MWPFKPKSGPWAPFRPTLPVTGWDGQKLPYGPCMRRWRDGEWQYRPMTPDEAAEQIATESF